MVPEMVLFCAAPDMNNPNRMKLKNVALPALFVAASLSIFSGCARNSSPSKSPATTKEKAKKDTVAKKAADTAAAPVVYKPIDHKLYDSLMKKLANGDTTGKWPVKNTPYPIPGAIL